jgi:hypothetical protein
MRQFIVKITYFVVTILVLVIVCLFLPVTPRASKSFLFSMPVKDSLLKNMASPRIIFVGGSNISFGLNSAMIKDSLHMNPVDVAIHAGIGLKSMMENTLPFIKSGDVIVLVPEYQHFYRDYNYGTEELLRSVWEVDRSKCKELNIHQVVNMLSFVPKYAFSKLNPMDYLSRKEDLFYSVHSFNQYGDANAHWTFQKIDFPQDQKIEGPINDAVILGIKAFQSAIEKKQAVLLISYPAYQDHSFINSKEKISDLQKELEKNKFTVLGTPEKYMMPDSLMFNTPYHLTKKGVDYRTALLIGDYRKLYGLHSEN